MLPSQWPFYREIINQSFCVWVVPFSLVLVVMVGELVDVVVIVLVNCRYLDLLLIADYQEQHQVVTSIVSMYSPHLALLLQLLCL